MTADIGVAADDPAQIGYAEGYESYRSAYGYRTRDKKHYGEQQKGLAKVAQFDFLHEMACKTTARGYGRPKSCCEQDKGKGYIRYCDAFKVEISRTPKVILFQEFSGRCVRDHDGTERTDESAEKDAECYKIPCTYAQGHQETYGRTQKRADETSHRQRTPAGHRGYSGTETCGTAQTKAVDIAKLVAPEILHLDTTDRKGYSRHDHI